MLRFIALVALLLVPAQWLPAAQDVWTGVQRVVAIGDVHGDYDQFLTVLQDAGLTNKKGKWIGGKTHFVQTGDIPDRGPDTRKIMDLMMNLEKQARKAGGYAHSLIGNHDAMNVYGDLRYVTPEEFAAFRQGNSEQVRDVFYQQHVEEIKQNPPPDCAPEIDEAYKKKTWYDAHPLGYFEQRFAYGPKGDYGKWIRDNSAVIKINDTLFLHGGVSPRLATMSISEINETVKKELEDFSLLRDGLTMASDGPVWYRGLAQGSETELTAHVDAALKHFGVQRIVIGHTPTAGTVIPRFGGKVLMIDVGLAEYYGSRRACLMIENGIPHTLHRGVELALPGGSQEELLDYLEKAAALDPAPSPLLPLIEQLSAPVAAAAAN